MNATSAYHIFLHHGLGTNGRQLNMNFGRQMAALGYNVVAMDNPGYGMTVVNQKDIIYQDWIQCFVGSVNSGTTCDLKGPILYGLGAVGMVCYNNVGLVNEVAGVIGRCFFAKRFQASSEGNGSL